MQANALENLWIANYSNLRNLVCDLLEANRSLDNVAWYLRNSMLISTHIALNPVSLNFY